MNEMIQKMIDLLVTASYTVKFPALIILFVVALAARYLVYYTVKRSDWFAAEFERRVLRYLEEGNVDNNPSFYLTTKKLFEITFYEIFENREKLGRRKGDKMMTLADRVFLIKEGSAWLIRDVLRQARILKFKDQPSFNNITKVTMENNPCFTRLFGVIPVEGINDVLNVLPSVFIIAGIFGTFLGITAGLPTLSGIDMTNVDKTKMVMDQFLMSVAFAMSASILGIMFSVVTNIYNTIFSPEKVYGVMIDRFENSMMLLWNASKNNDLPKDLEFHDHRDPKEVLAENSIYKEIMKHAKSRTAPFNKEDIAGKAS